jgi:hypothetical protein
MDQRALNLAGELLRLKSYPVGALSFTDRGREAMRIHAEQMRKVYAELKPFGINDVRQKRGKVELKRS